jgi:DNA-3-methyladenine glycosylase I
VDPLKPPHTRCPWAESNALQRAYHDREWGVPVHDDPVLFEFLILEGAQAGLSWDTILKKRENYRRAFAGFDARRLARFGRRERAALLADEGIVRNRLKIEAAISNAACFLEVQQDFGSFAGYVWTFVGGRPRQNRWTRASEVPAVTPEASAMSRELRRRGFRFVGPTICYAFMQATGMVNDHLTSCFRHEQVRQAKRGAGIVRRAKA